MDIALLILGSILMIVGLVGCLIPIIPGPPLGYLGLLALHFSKFGEFSEKFLWIFAVVTVIVTALDYWIPAWGTQKFGGSNYGKWGSFIGIFVGLFFPPFGIILGPFIGAVVGELIKQPDFNKALKAGLGSFIGFLIGTGIKLIATIVMTYYFVVAIIDYF
ncbi:DUF456 domain-containing protein [Fulvivirgaceae bacterium BMA10]|uniref:DUF456 domain-containing protein n=1 Tax=Splendidivirga corallicola TaxID=3051826 RepID=A0ABT8KW05_9BACT|nr:DUF456 domain-containing protein [Fulvivirgaceae bacterium BMA10]